MRILFKTVLLAVAVVALCVVASAQDARLRIDSLDRLEAKASKTVDVSIDEKMIGMVAKIVRNADPKDEDTQKAASLLADVKAIYVKSYEFDNEGEYLPADVDGIRAQVKGAGWERLVGVRSKKDGENAEVYVLMQADKVLGLAIIAADPKELTVVNIVGSINLDRLSELDGDFGLPRMQLKREPKPNN